MPTTKPKPKTTAKTKTQPRRYQPRKPNKRRNGAAQLLSTTPFGPSLTLRRYQLGNGLKILVLPDGSAPVVSYHTWFGVGSKHEQPGKTGLAHLFEHLMFNETQNLPAGAFDQRIEAAGGETNAATWTDWTHYHADLPASELPLILELEADRMENLVLRAPQVASEKEVVMNERRQRVDDDVEGTVFEQLYALAFRKHPYHWPTIGWMPDIESFSTRDCEHFYRTFYAPNNAILVVAGDVDPGDLVDAVARRYGKLPAARLPRFSAPREAPQRAERVKRLRWPTRSYKLAVGYRAPALGDADYAVLSLINELLFVGRGSRMFRRLLRQKGLVAELHGSIAPFADPGLYEMWLSLRPGVRLDAAMAALDEELARIVDKRVSQRELARVKNRFELAFLLGLETASGKAEQLGFYECVLGDAGRLMRRLEEYRKVSTDDIQRVARAVLDPRRRTRIEVHPVGEEGAAA